MALKLTNNASSTLAGSLTTGATSMTVQTGEGARFPALSAGDWFPATLVKLVGGVPAYEIVRVTARSVDTMTITRAQEGTTALTFSAGDRVELRLTAGALAVLSPAMSDADAYFYDDVDTTKKLKFQLSGITSGQERTATVPDRSGTLALQGLGSSIASASTVNLDTATGDLVHITGTTAITAITLASGTSRDVVFDGALTLTHGASLILPGAANITTAAGDRATFRGDGSGVVRCMHYTKADGSPIVAQAVTGEMEVLTSGTSWTAPPDVYWVKLRMSGGGASGAVTPSTSDTGYPGAAGGYLEKIISVSPGTSYAYAIGAGGASVGPTGPVSGNAGGATTFNDGTTTYTANGGGAPTASATGAGGTAVNGDINIAGGTGYYLTTNSTVGGANPLGSPFTSKSTSPSSGGGYGNGGGGARSGYMSGAGTSGVIILEYIN